MLMRSLLWGALVAAVFIAYQGIRGNLDVGAVVFGVVFGAAYGTIDYFRNRKQRQ